VKRANREKVNLTAEVEEGQEAVVRKSWQTPVVEELLMNQTENTLTFSGSDNGIYTS
jgi:hypothetical protein